MHDFEGDAVIAVDGEIGSLADAYFDDERWKLRYLVVDIGRWLPGHKVLVAPQAMVQDDESVMRLALTRDEVRRSPGIDADPPFSALLEQARARDHEPRYSGPFLWGFMPVAAPPAEGPHNSDPSVMPENRAAHAHLRSACEVAGYRIRAADGEIGHVADFIIDDADWTITGVVVDTGKWLSGKRVVVPPEAIEAIDAQAQTVRVRLSRQEIERAPAPGAVEA
jgi:uncharacterized protein YrrD